ncbi:hypothetical protein ZWY2020_015742 [Hordeum vulgare]|nr:hypothetical protein ZWY2020_015742 [Hordeum vulgare]
MPAIPAFSRALAPRNPRPRSASSPPLPCSLWTDPPVMAALAAVAAGPALATPRGVRLIAAVPHGHRTVSVGLASLEFLFLLVSVRLLQPGDEGTKC